MKGLVLGPGLAQRPRDPFCPGRFLEGVRGEGPETTRRLSIYQEWARIYRRWRAIYHRGVGIYRLEEPIYRLMHPSSLFSTLPLHMPRGRPSWNGSTSH